MVEINENKVTITLSLLKVFLVNFKRLIQSFILRTSISLDRVAKYMNFINTEMLDTFSNKYLMLIFILYGT